METLTRSMTRALSSAEGTRPWTITARSARRGGTDHQILQSHCVTQRGVQQGHLVVASQDQSTLLALRPSQVFDDFIELVDNEPVLAARRHLSFRKAAKVAFAALSSAKSLVSSARVAAERRSENVVWPIGHILLTDNGTDISLPTK